MPDYCRNIIVSCIKIEKKVQRKSRYKKIKARLYYFITSHHDKVQLQGRGHNSESNIFGVMSLLTKYYKQIEGP